ncbi:exopolysaccharide transport family protein [Planctomyces sp. SH-PL62]|uniref:exopolysaccharide transport family protein n=1 Tax=Planctomyces sp. SH-PL62 TaxID=1636152 RepID=UPI0018D376CF|nr:AAA family ATPase [Planctomyces sp. SH-PL62]
MQVNPTSILRGLLRNWWKILGLWLIASLPLVYGIYTQVKPTYIAYSVIRIEPTQPELFGSSSRGDGSSSIERIIETARAALISDRVLNGAIIDPQVSGLPFIKGSLSPRTELKERLAIVNPRNTEFVHVSLESTNPEEAAAIVNAVVASYLQAQNELTEGADGLMKKSLEDYLKKMIDDKKEKVKELSTLMSKGKVDSQSLTPNQASQANTAGPAAPADGTVQDSSKARNLGDVSIEQYRKWKDRLLETQVDLFQAKALLEQRTADYQNGAEIEQLESGLRPSEEELTERIQAAFLADPAIADLRDEILTVRDRLSHVVSNARKGNDPSKRAHEARLKQLEGQHADFWAQRYPEIRAQILAELEGRPTPTNPVRDESIKSIPELRADVEALERERKAITEALAQAELETKESNSETYTARYLQAEIDSMTHDQQIVHRRLEDLKFRTDRDMVRVSLYDRAAVPRVPSSSKRIKLMAAAPMGIMALVLGIFSLLEVKAERVGDPDQLSTRVQSEVYSLPPIPMSRSPRRLGAPGDDDQIERFIQRLDHLRFAVCGDHPEVGLGRCVLISSAVGGEGKTTLAAQLAARCGHSGHSTLLIDADLRRGALSPLLDVADSKGLSDLLMNEDLNPEDLAIPVQGGTFHLLSAGTPTSDTSRVFQGRAFGMLIARLRQLYDLIIIDSPPILPVPDALIMGRWTDGVVLTSRYDVSRAPQVERARRQLDLAGIPVLGTVINGMRTSDSYYGRYSYSRPGASTTDRERPADATSAG